MAVRNFWIKVSVDGRKLPLAGGPRGKDGGFSCIVYQRNKGKVEEACRLEGTSLGELLHLQIKKDGKVLLERNTER